MEIKRQLKNHVMMNSNKYCFIVFVLYTVLYFSIFQSAFSMLYRWWSGEDYSYCYLVLPIFAYMVWEKWKALQNVQTAPSWIGLAPLLFGIFFFWVGELGGEYFTLYLASWLVLVGLFWIHMGSKKLKIIWFPIVFLLTMYPPPAFVYNNLSLRLKLISSKLGVKTLQMFGMIYPASSRGCLQRSSLPLSTGRSFYCGRLFFKI